MMARRSSDRPGSRPRGGLAGARSAGAVGYRAAGCARGPANELLPAGRSGRTARRRDRQLQNTAGSNASLQHGAGGYAARSRLVPGAAGRLRGSRSDHA